VETQVPQVLLVRKAYKDLQAQLLEIQVIPALLDLKVLLVQMVLLALLDLRVMLVQMVLLALPDFKVMLVQMVLLALLAPQGL
jgi:hypothetical protein